MLAVPEKQVLENDKVLDAFKGVYEGSSGGGMEDDRKDPVVASGKDTVETLEGYRKVVAKHRSETKGTYPSSRLGQKLQDVAALVVADAGLEVACVDVGGWDHHANEGGAAGTMAKMLEDVATSLAAFAKDLGPRMERTLVLVMTEFGRTCRENGNGGTDHGHGSAALLLGGAVAGGKVHGTWTGLSDDALWQARDLPVTTDFRCVFAEVLRHHLGFEPTKDFFLEFKPGPVKGLFKA